MSIRNRFRLAYPSLPFEHILASNSDRVCAFSTMVSLLNLRGGLREQVIESAQWFRAGMFGRYEDGLSDVSIIAEDNMPLSTRSFPPLSLFTHPFLTLSPTLIHSPPIDPYL